ncbi:tetratricopeptide repeat protein [Dinghuibacter silviterrae]|uniref:Antitoxin component YwqK of YwqJK toxin-antitoxin module n=1 Tax=Dinghuibacter silviterrae TaxID=1539049 RepID=A0A4R8DWY3_9BACT|nr:tetratricopeptide repeat protein [Dinghuibacter silviterrae]TDX01721.1 antitoxin component YwqK of YwqJK toxin-antitoxin module [Dinghuibacter silviterrae]
MRPTLCILLALAIGAGAYGQTPGGGQNPGNGQKPGELPNSGNLLENGRKLHDDGQYKQAIALYQTVSPNDTNYSQVLHELSMSAYADSDFEAAKGYAEKGLAWFPDQASDWYALRAEALDELGQKDSALADYDRAIERSPYNYEAYFNRGVCLYHLQRMTEATRDFERCVLIQPEMASAHYFLGLTAIQDGNVVPCMLSFMTYLALKPQGRYARTVVALMTSLSNVTDEVAGLAAKRQETGFAEETEIFLSKAALDKKYVLHCDLEDPIVRQMQALLEKTAYRPEDTGFWMQYYVPYFKKVYDDGQFNALVYDMFSGFNIKEVTEWLKHHNDEIKAFAQASEAYFQKIVSTEQLIPANRDTVTRKCLLYDNRIEGLGNYTGFGQDVTLGAGPWVFFYNTGAVKSTGALDDHTQRTGEWRFYHPNGLLKEVSHYQAGKLEDTTHAWFDNGMLNQVVPWVDDHIQGHFRSWYYNGLPHMVSEYEGGKRTGPSIEYTSNGFLLSRFTMKDGEPDGLCTTYFINGQTSMEEPYVNGKLQGRRLKYNAYGTLTEDASFDKGEANGPWKTFYPSGHVHETYTYEHGDLEGVYTEYYDNGKVRQTQPYTKGKADGKESDYTEGGLLFEEDTYEKGKIRAVQFYGPDGKPTQSGAIRASGGTLTYYDSLGTRISEGAYSFKGDKEGVYTYFYPTGEVSGRSVYKAGALDGPRVNYYRDGRLEDSIQYAEGQEQGYYAYYYENGRVRQEGWYDAGERTGPYREYDAFGHLTSESFFVNGEQNGLATNYAPNGRKTIEFRYRTGWPVHITEWDTAGGLLQDKDIPPGETAFHTWFAPGKEASEGHYRNYHPDGAFQFFYPDHKLLTRRFYRQGLADSTYIEYYHDGGKEMEGTYRLGSRVGLWKEYYPDGTLRTSYTCKDDNMDGKHLIYNEDGTLLREENYEDGTLEGPMQHYGDSNRVSYTYFYHHGNLYGYGYAGRFFPLPGGTGTVKAFYPNGQKSAELTVVDGEVDGVRTLWFSNGQLDFTGLKKMGKDQGLQKGYYPNGHIKSEEENYYDNLHGRCRYYYPTGVLYREEYYYNGDLEGVSVMYDPKGNLKQTTVYYYGVLQAIY